MMGGLKNIWNLFRDGQGKDEQIAMPHIKGLIKMKLSGTLGIQSLRDSYHIVVII